MSEIFDFDYIGFVYDGYHSVRDLKIYRTSSGNRYNLFANSSYQDDTYAEGIEGQTFLKSKIKSISFQIPFAFDSLTKEDIKKIKQIFSSTKVCEISFDERPYVAYDVKLSQPLKLDYLVFEEDGKDVYKGEGNLQLVCYDGCGHTPHYTDWENPKDVLRTSYAKTYPMGLYLPNGTYQLQKMGSESNFSYQLKGFTDEDTALLASMIEYTGNNVSYYNINKEGAKGILIKEILIDSLEDEIAYPVVPNAIYKTDFSTDEPFAIFDGYGFVCENKKTLNGYSYGKYPTKFEWTNFSFLPWYDEKFEKDYDETNLSITNRGELPMPIKFSSMRTQKLINFNVTITEVTGTYHCDTKTGKIVRNSARNQALQFKGNSMGFLLVGDTQKYSSKNLGQTSDIPFLQGLQYDYLYY